MISLALSCLETWEHRNMEFASGQSGLSLGCSGCSFLNSFFSDCSLESIWRERHALGFNFKGTSSAGWHDFQIPYKRKRWTSRRVGNRPVPTSVVAKLQLLICTVLMVFITKEKTISYLFPMVTPKSLIITMQYGRDRCCDVRSESWISVIFLRFELHNRDISTIEKFHNTGYITGLDMCKVCTRSSPFRSTLNTGYITGLDMCKVCTEAVHSVALWTRVTSQVWTCVKYEPKQSIP